MDSLPLPGYERGEPNERFLMAMHSFLDRVSRHPDNNMMVLTLLAAEFGLPPGGYGFAEFYCDDPGCDCRQVTLEVSEESNPQRVLATLNYGWDSLAFYRRRMHGDETAAGELVEGSLDPLHPQSDLAPGLLRMFQSNLASGSQLPQRLRQHYELFRRMAPGEGGAGAGPDTDDVLMSVPEILAQLSDLPEEAEYEPYERALRGAKAHWEAVVPDLIAALEAAAANPREYLDNPRRRLHLFALYLLADMRERRALPSFIRFFSLPEDFLQDLVDEAFDQNAAVLLASVCGGDSAPLLELILDESRGRLVREEALEALAVQQTWSERSREAVTADLRAVFHSLARPGQRSLWGHWVAAVVQVPARELLPEIRQAFEQDLIAQIGRAHV